MNELDDLIQFENENTSLDFKRTQYSKKNAEETYDDLIKDIMAMANANVQGDRFIIVGVKHFPDGSRQFFSIDDKDFIDSATYHQIIRENVEPEIHFEYSPYRHEGHLLGVFRIHSCDDPPYMMRKDFGNLKKGDAFIRKGTHQPRMVREDFARIIQARVADSGFTGVIRIGFQAPGQPKELEVPAAGNIVLPSDLAAKRIREILEARQRTAGGPFKTIYDLSMFPPSVFGRRTYEQKTTEELQEDLKKVKDSYQQADLHELYEVIGNRINLLITNEGASYVEDSILKIELPRVDGIRVAAKIFRKPVYDSFGIRRIDIPILNRYPRVKYHKEQIEVRDAVGTLRHGIPQQAFDEPIRVLFENSLIGQEIKLHCTLYGKQLRTPRTEELTIKVIEPNPHQ